jgi:hypothetical protein
MLVVKPSPELGTIDGELVDRFNWFVTEFPKLGQPPPAPDTESRNPKAAHNVLSRLTREDLIEAVSAMLEETGSVDQEKEEFLKLFERVVETYSVEELLK